MKQERAAFKTVPEFIPRAVAIDIPEMAATGKQGRKSVEMDPPRRGKQSVSLTARLPGKHDAVEVESVEGVELEDIDSAIGHR